MKYFSCFTTSKISGQFYNLANLSDKKLLQLLTLHFFNHVIVKKVHVLFVKNLCTALALYTVHFCSCIWLFSRVPIYRVGASRFPIWPEWNEADISAEKWDSGKVGKEKEKAGKSPISVSCVTCILFCSMSGFALNFNRLFLITSFFCR